MHLQQQLAALSPRGTFIVARGSGHYVQNDRPGTVIDPIRRMAQAVEADPVDHTASVLQRR